MAELRCTYCGLTVEQHYGRSDGDVEVVVCPDGTKATFSREVL